jgi:adenosylhomocysteine nucleosidase
MRIRSRRIAAGAAALALLAAVGDAVTAAGAAQAEPRTAPVGIVSADGAEQAAVLARIHVTGHHDIAGYRYWTGTVDGHPVVDVAAGEKDESAELATWLLDETFHPRATLFSGTAGSQNSRIDVGDVTLAGYVVDKSDIHYQSGGYQTAYSGIEIHRTAGSDTAGAVVDGYGEHYPTPANAGSYQSTTDKSWLYVAAFAGSRDVVRAGAPTALGSTSKAVATGDPSATGQVANKVVVGTVGDANVWTEPLSWVEAQNLLYQSDAEENEGTGFAYANAAAGVPWTLVRGISDTPWYPKAFSESAAVEHAARVVERIVDTLPTEVSRTPVTESGLSPLANATRAGYLIAGQAYFSVSPVTEVRYQDSAGGSHTLTGAALKRLESEYAPGSGDLG